MQLVTSQELEEMKSNGDKVLVDFYATWCGPCKSLMPLLQSIEGQNSSVKFVKMDVDQNRDYIMELGIRSVPTVMVFNGSEMVNSSAGLNNVMFYKGILNTL
jgi:thioredoxin 1